MSVPSTNSIFGALVILSPDKREVLAVPQRSLLRENISLRFPGTTVATTEAANPHLLAAAERIISTHGSPEERVSRTHCFFSSSIESAEVHNWGADVNSLIRSEVDHAKVFLCFVMRDTFDWSLTRKQSVPKRSDEFLTELLEPRLVPLEHMASPPDGYAAPRAHRAVATKLASILQERVWLD